ncbi:MAG TPA: type VI secretion system-associated protein TagF [Micropepsaceae bacterium]|nr:type VI secretion system-associated protein TagF [Micropepsaceae bacterium]
MSERAVIADVPPNARAFCLGKLPQHADFVSRGLPAAEADEWFEILSRGLAAAREQTAELFESAHDAAPPWRFVFSTGEPESAWCAGAIAPSIDRTGRRFFFVAAADQLEWQQAIVHGAVLAGNLEEAVYRAIGESLTVDEAYAIAEETLCCCDPGSEAALAKLTDLCGEGVWWTPGGPLHAPRTEAGGAITADLVCGFIVPSVELTQ